MFSSVNTIRSVFEYQTLQPFTGEPDYDAFNASRDKLKTTLGGENH